MDVGSIYTLDTAAAEAALDRLTAADAQLRGAIATTTQQSNAGFLAAAQAATGYSDRLAAATSELRDAQAATRSAAAEVQRLVQANRDLAAAQKASTSTAEYNRLTGLIAQNTAKIREAKQAILENKAATDQERAAVQAVTEARRQEVNATKQVTAANKDAVAAAKESSGGIGGFFSDMATKALAAGAAFFAFGKIASEIKEGLANFGAISGIKNTFNALADSADEGGHAFDFVKERANALGLELIPTAKAYSLLFASAKETNFPLKETELLFDGITAAGKVLNSSQEETTSAFRAVERMLTSNTVTSRELKLQLGVALPGAFGLAAKAAGLTTEELTKQLKAGNILAQDLLPKLSRQLLKTYGEGTEAASQGVRSNMGRITTYFQESSARIGEFFAPFLAALAQLVTTSKTAAQASDSLVASYGKQNTGLASLKAEISPLIVRYDQLTSLTSRNTTEQKELDTIIAKIAKTVPGAVTAFDAYGKGLDINSKAVKQFIKDQEDLVAYNNKGDLKSNSGELRKLLTEQARLQRELSYTEIDPKSGLKLRREAAPLGQNVQPLLLSQQESDAITNDLTKKLAQVQTDVRANLNNRQLLRGKSPLLPMGDDAANDKAIQGLIEKQQLLITNLKERQKNAAQEGSGAEGDFLFGKGGLNGQLTAAEKELQRLEGRVTKTRAKAAGNYETQLRALLTERATLTSLAAKAAESSADDATSRAKAVFTESLRQVEAVKAKLEQRETDLAKQARKVGGAAAVAQLGGLADGQIDGVQARQLSTLRLAALDKYYTDLAKITVEREQRLFDLREASDEKEVEAVERKYDKQLRVAKDAIEREAVELARQAAQLALKAQQEQARIARTAALATSQAQAVGQTYGAGTGVSVFEAKRAEAQALLNIEKKTAEDSLNNTLNKNNEAAELERAALRAQLARIAKQQKELTAQEKASDFSIYKLVLGDKDTPELRKAFEDVASSALQSIGDILNAEQAAAATRAGNATTRIGELQSQLSAEIQLNKDGSASNIRGLQEQIATEKTIRREALEQQRRAAKEKVLIDTLTQISSLVTAVAEIFAATAPLNAVPGLGLAIGVGLSAALVGAFAASKVSAYSAANDIGKGFFVGGYTGDGDKYETKGTVHGGEFVSTKETTTQYRSLLEALHRGRPLDTRAVASIAHLLPDMSLPGQMSQERTQYQLAMQQQANGPLLADLAGLRAELAHIRGTNQRMADAPIVTAMPDGYLETDPATGSAKRVRFSD